MSGSGGKDVGAFNAAIDVPAGVSWTNRDQTAVIDRSASWS
ncbi:MAG: hypothetical protein R2762_07530 [Bryobacteraceae bacterium]